LSYFETKRLSSIASNRLSNMKHLLLRALVSFLPCVAAHSSSADTVAPAPFTLTVVPSLSRPTVKSITIADDNPKEFYVVLTNTSKDPQPVFETWNSWGFRTVSFEFTMPDGKKFDITRGTEVWTVNYPSTFLISPGEHQVYAIRLDKRWESHPRLPADDEGQIQITLKAIYQADVTPEATEHKVWTGRIESKPYEFTLERRQNSK
jgi:hypothetical protein